MRQIKFRAWIPVKYLPKDNPKEYFEENIMVYGDILKITANDYSDLIFEQMPNIKENTKKIYANFSCDNEKGILMQFTGLKDKNGKEIYEGDIVKLKDGNIIQINWDNDTCGFIVENNVIWNYLTKDYVLEVIGNIYENPELLEEKK